MLRVEAALVLGALALLGAAGARAPRLRATLACVAALAAGALALGHRLDAAAAARPREPVERTLEATVRETRRSGGWVRVDLDDASGVEAGTLPPPRRVRVQGEAAPAGTAALEDALPGERVRARLRLRAPRSLRNPGAPASDRQLARAGIGAVARLAHPALHVRLPEREGPRPLAGLHRLRAELAARLVAAGPGGGLLAALAVGDRRGLAPERGDAFAHLGVAHVLAVSGLHLALVAASVFGVTRRGIARCAFWSARRDARPAALCLALVAVLGYALLAGWGVPVRRALAVVVALALAVARGRPGARGHPLAGAAIGVLALDPGALFRPGPQLSFAASGALLLASRPEPQDPTPSRVARTSLAILRTSAAAGAVTAPLIALHFGGRVAPFALLANVVVVPWTAAVLLPLAFAAAAACAFPLPGAALVLHAAERTAAGTLAAAELAAARLPGAGPGAPPATPWLLAAFALAAGAVRARATGRRAAWAAATAACLALARPAALPPAPPRLVALDVGQGAATLVQGRSAALLFDAGTRLPGGVDLGRRAVVPALAALGVRRLDLLVASHADLDHRGGIPAVLRALPVGALWLPLGGRADPAFAAVVEAARARGVSVAERGADFAPARFGDLRVTPLWPARPAPPGARNAHSLVVRVEVGATRVLLPGDVGAATERTLVARGADLRADVLVLAHHGSRTSSDDALLRAVAPRVAIASAPRFGRFGMPHAEVRGRLRRAGTSLWWTGRDGAVLVGLGRPLTAWGFDDAPP